MRTASKVFNKQMCRAAGSVVPYQRQDLTKKWMGRVQQKAKDQHGQENVSKLGSLIDYYNRPAKSFNDNINWGYWKDNIRTTGLVEGIRGKYDEFKTYTYNVDSIAQRSAINSEKYDNYGLFLKWNYHLWMKQYLDNNHTINAADALGDISYVSFKELYNYVPGTQETAAAWRETGHYIRSKLIKRFIIIFN
jgi:hypothetical protein